MIDYYKSLYKGSSSEFYKNLDNYLINCDRKFIITANPEIFIMSEDNNRIKQILNNKKNIIVPDGISIVKTARMLGFDCKERITGIDISSKLIELGNKYSKSIYLYGARQEVLNRLVLMIKANYPNINIVGAENGYDKEYYKVFNDIKLKEPDIVLVAFGVPKQELMINEYYNDFKKGIFVGVGGTFDTLSGFKKRAPKIFIKLNLEWIYRIIKEPSRIKRFWNNNVKFIIKIRKYKRKN